MELIINIIIILVIVASVLKRMNEVSTKSGKIKGAPQEGNTPVRPPIISQGEIDNEDAQTVTIPAGNNDTTRPSHPVLPSEWDVRNELEEILRNARDTVHHDEMPETRSYQNEEARLSFDNAQPQIKTAVETPVETPAHRGQVGEISLGPNDFVRGIIMQEILGTPVSMRRNEDYGGIA